MKAFLEPYYGGSHKSFADAVVKQNPDEIILFTLHGRHWKWRMHGAAVSLGQKVLDSGIDFKNIIATSLIDLALLKSIISPKLPKCRYTIFFHENQLCYPWSQNDNDPTERKDLHYGFINFTSALVADKVVFNSNYNMNSFFNALKPFLKAFPDENLDGTISKLIEKSEVIYPGFEPVNVERKASNDIPVILWNHRWEYDKNPDEFFKALFELKDKGVKFRLAVAGEERMRAPKIFAKAKEILKNEIISWGYIESREQYCELLSKCDFLPVTSHHEFFGISVLEAVSAGVIPILPERLTYPELFPKTEFGKIFYANNKLAEFVEKLICNRSGFDRSKIMKRADCFNCEKSVMEFGKLFIV